MRYDFSSFSIPLLVNALICGFFAFYGWRHRAKFRLGTPFAKLMAAISGWSLSYGLEIAGANIYTKSIWETAIIICIALSGVFYLLLAIEYTGREHWLKPRNTFLLALPALVTIILVLSNSHHHLIWREIRLDASGPFLATIPIRGPWFWVHAGLTWLYMIIALILYAQSLIRTPRTFRIQGSIMIIGGLFPVLGNLLHITGIIRVPGLDLGPFFSTFSGILMGWGLFRFRFLDLAPVAQRAILESMRDGVLVLDERGRIVEINQMAKTLLELNSSDPIGQEQVLQPVLEQAAKAESGEILIETSSSKRWVTVSAPPLLDSRGRQIGTLITLQDTTESHQLEQMRDDLRQMLVHDLRNPLTIIQTGLNLIAGTAALSATDQRILEMSRSNSARAVMLVNAILDENHLEHKRMVLEPIRIDLHAIISEVIESMTPLAQIQAITITHQIPESMSAVWADERLLVRILQNLIDNAIKFSPKNGKIVVEVEEREEFLEISISDSGPGIHPSLHARIFDKFATGDYKRRGSGLGLAFCRMAVTAHGGEIWVESSAAQGASFFFTLPKYQGQDFTP